LRLSVLRKTHVKEFARMSKLPPLRFIPILREYLWGGRRLGTVVMAKVIRRFFADGRTFSILETDDFRLPAIASYLGQGFIPHYIDPDHEGRWSKVFEQLAQGRRTAGNK